MLTTYLILLNQVLLIITISADQNMYQQTNDKYLIRLKDCAEQEKFDLIKQKITKFAKYFFDPRSLTLIIYDQTFIYIISQQQTKIIDLGRQHPIIQLTYNPIKNILCFLNHDGNLLVHFINHKTQFTIRKDIKKQSIFGWLYGKDNFDLFVAQPNGIRLFKLEEEKKCFKQIKCHSGKFNSFLYEPNSQTLIAFPQGDCRFVNSFLFDDETKSKNWYRGPQISINIESDETLMALAKRNKNLGLHSSYHNFQLFLKQQAQQFAAEAVQINQKCYIVFYYGSEGKLKLYAISEEGQKQVVIKLPSDCLPKFVIVDNMLVINLKNQKITFIYDINIGVAQMLVSPFPVEHTSKAVNPYLGVFAGRRHIMPDGYISKWSVNVMAIFNYLKNQQQIFDFLIKRQKAKMELIKWLRQNLFKFKQVNLSKFWKGIFIKSQSKTQKDRDVLSITEIYSNLFYTLYNDQLIPKQPLLSILLECIRQAREIQIKIPSDLQKLLFDMLLDCKKYEILVFLCHSDIIKDSQELVQILLRKVSESNEQILFTLAIDMANRVCKPQKFYEMLIVSQNTWMARRYLKQNYQSIQVLFMIYVLKEIKDVKIRQQFTKLVRSFILRKFPSISQKYLNEAEQKMKQGSYVSNLTIPTNKQGISPSKSPNLSLIEQNS